MVLHPVRHIIFLLFHYISICDLEYGSRSPCSFADSAGQVIQFCSWARHSTSTAPHSLELNQQIIKKINPGE